MRELVAVCRSHAMRYARDELRYSRPVVYGTHCDTKGLMMIWVKDYEDKTEAARGLVVHEVDGVLEEFDPEVDGQPKEVH